MLLACTKKLHAPLWISIKTKQALQVANHVLLAISVTTLASQNALHRMKAIITTVLVVLSLLVKLTAQMGTTTLLMDHAYLLIAGSVLEDTSVLTTQKHPLKKFKFALRATTALKELNRPLSVQ